jgi:hypothetical protein
MMLPEEKGLTVWESTWRSIFFYWKSMESVGSLFKVYESYSEARLYLREKIAKEKEDPLFLSTDSIRSPPSPPEGVGIVRSHTPEEKISDLFNASMLDLVGRSMTGDQSKGKEGKLFGYSVLDMGRLINGLVPDPERLPEIMKKHFTEQRADFMACPWSEGQGGPGR